MPKLPAFEPVFQRLMDDPAASLDRLRADPQDFEDNALDEEKGALRTDAAIPALESISALVFDQAGALVGQFGPQWLPQVHAFADLLNRANLPSNHTNLLSFRSDEGGAVNAVWAKNEDAADWNLPKAVRSAIDANPLGHIALSVSGAESGRALQEAARSFGLTSLEQKIVAAVVRSGSGRGAANATGLSYATVRESLAKASRRMNAPNLPALVKKVVAAAFGVLPSDHDGSAMIAEMLPLTERQANIAVMIADGVSRKETAIAMRLSAAVVKKELEQIFALLGVTSAAELARLVVEVRALRAFARSTDGAPGFFDSSIEPTRFLSRPNDREIIAWSDYGPASGRPVLVVHSNWSCRSVPRPLVVRLQAAGWRPIAIDRPGFGSTHPGALSRGDPFGQAIADTIQVLDRIGVERIAVIARCGAQYVTAVKHAIPRRIGPVVLISPSAPTAESARRHGVVGVIKEAFHRSPRLIDFYFRVICAQLTLERTERLTRAIVAGSRTDAAMCDDEDFIRDRFRAIRPFTTGNLIGAVIEENLISRDSFAVPDIEHADWAIMQGEDDVQFAANDVMRYWSGKLPSARTVLLSDGGRFITSSHPQQIVDLLEKMEGEPPKSRSA